VSNALVPAAHDDERAPCASRRHAGLAPALIPAFTIVAGLALLSPGSTLSAQPLEGYVWPLSAAPQQTLDFYVSGDGNPEVEFLRHMGDANPQSMGRTSFEPSVQRTVAEPWRYGAGWSRSFSYTIPAGWPSGIYSARLSTSGSVDFHIVFIVRPAPGAVSNLAVIANVNTWLAYNRWGGSGKYDEDLKPARVSFLRPSPNTSPVGTGMNHLTRAELWVLGWLESQGRRPDVYTDLDFHNGLLDGHGYDTLVLSTHPEYWSRAMYQRLRSFLDGGGSLLYLGGNGIYENAEYSDDQTGMIFRAGVEGGPRSDALFRRLDPPMPERALLGVATERCGVGSPHTLGDRCSKDVHGGYEVLQSDHPFFAGVATQGEVIGEAGTNIFGDPDVAGGQASAWEVDTATGPGASGIPCDCGIDDVPVPAEACSAISNRIALMEETIDALENGPQGSAPSGEPLSTPTIEDLKSQLALARPELDACRAAQGLPQGITVLARGRNWCENGVLREATTPLDATKRFECVGGRWQGAEMVVYNHQGGGLVFSVGSMTFGGSLVSDGRLQAVVLRVLEEAARRGGDRATAASGGGAPRARPVGRSGVTRAHP
jgi:hypothetical protein